MENPQTGSSAPQQQQQPASADNREEEPVQDTDQESRPEELAEHQTNDLSSTESSEPKRKKANDQPNLQAADSDSVKCPNCGTTVKISDQCVQATEENVQPEQVPVDQTVPQELRAAWSHLGPVDVEHLKKSIAKTSIDPKELLQLLKDSKTAQETSDSGGKTSETLMRLFKKNPQFTVKIHSVVTGQTFRADSEILEQVKTIKSTRVQTTTNYQDCDVIIVFCPIVSRAGSDVEAAMRQSPGDKPAILVLLHHTRDVDYSTDGKRWREIYQNIVLDVDVLFHQTQPGLLQCDRNKQAVQKIMKVLKEHSKRR